MTDEFTTYDESPRPFTRADYDAIRRQFAYFEERPLYISLYLAWMRVIRGLTSLAALVMLGFLLFGDRYGAVWVLVLALNVGVAFWHDFWIKQVEAA